MYLVLHFLQSIMHFTVAIYLEAKEYFMYLKSAHKHTLNHIYIIIDFNPHLFYLVAV